MKGKSQRAEILLLLEMLSCHFYGKNPSRRKWPALVSLCVLVLTLTAENLAEHPPHPVNGVLGRSGLLSINLPRGKMARRVEWIYQTDGIWIATFEGGKFNRSHRSDRFGQRLQMASKTTLRIQELEMEDSGTYVARVLLGSTGGRDQTFSLNVYEPVPEPQITLQLISNAPDRCNVTLQCQAFGKGEFNVSWEKGNPPRMLEGGSDWYQLSKNSSDLHISWRPNFSATNFTCLASNPADQKKVSFDIHSVCLSKGGNQSRRKWPILVSLCVLVLILSAAGGIWLLKRRRKPRPTK